MPNDDLALKVWRLHPQGCPIVPAEKTLRGTANTGAVRFCGPFTNANRYGWWVFPPVDFDVVWKGENDFDYEVLTPYSDVDWHLIRFLIDEGDGADPDQWCRTGGRTKFTWGMVDTGTIQVWTGCIFQTPPGWGLQIRSPINFPPRACHIMEAVLETDWLYYDIWLNIVFDRPGELVQFRRDEWPPIAQLVPVRREGYDARWGYEEQTVNRNTEEASEVFEYFVEYNQKKFAGTGTAPIPNSTPQGYKDQSTYYKERKRLLKGPTSRRK